MTHTSEGRIMKGNNNHQMELSECVKISAEILILENVEGISFSLSHTHTHKQNRTSRKRIRKVPLWGSIRKFQTQIMSLRERTQKNTYIE